MYKLMKFKCTLPQCFSLKVLQCTCVCVCVSEPGDEKEEGSEGRQTPGVDQDT